MLTKSFSKLNTMKSLRLIPGIILTALLLTAAPDKIHAQSKAKTEISEQQVRSIIEKHLTLWNETDKAKRSKILNEIYAPDVEMVDRHFVAKGRSQVDGFIADLHKKNSDFRFKHAKPIDTHHNIALMYWQVGNTANPAVVTGMDFFVIENGKVQKLYVFVDGAK